MKTILKSSIVLTFFSISLFLFQIACEDEVEAQQANQGLTQQNKLIYINGANYSINQIQIMNLDGTGITDVPMTNLPPDLYWQTVRITPDGKTLVLSGYDANAGNVNIIYTMNTSGTDVKKIYQQPSNSTGEIKQVEQAY